MVLLLISQSDQIFLTMQLKVKANHCRPNAIALNIGVDRFFNKKTNEARLLALGLNIICKNSDLRSADSMVRSSAKSEGFSPIP